MNETPDGLLDDEEPPPFTVDNEAGTSPFLIVADHAGKYSHYRAVHRHLFQDVYPWAGKIRTVRIAKGDNAFCYPEHIDREMRRIFAQSVRQKKLRRLAAEDFAQKAAHFLAELNAVHPFREGNGPDSAIVFDHPGRAGRASP